ncbi:DUF4231 domain-containing protein [Ligilactobacillus murinus]|uniref:DUF4231 domain-containing protein n=1 Tax=Ligilactobacillus murinus TaxID=1622 RepID=UPI002F26AFB8
MNIDNKTFCPNTDDVKGDGIISEKDYLKGRLDAQISWYDEKSAAHKKWFYGLRVLQLLLTASIPFLTGLVLTYPSILKLISFFGFLLTVLEGILSLTKVHEKWIQYREICELLKKEKYMYLTKTGVYNTPGTDCFKTLVERCESIISNENLNWTNLTNARKKDA